MAILGKPILKSDENSEVLAILASPCKLPKEQDCLCWPCYERESDSVVPESLKRGQKLLKDSLVAFRENLKGTKEGARLLQSGIFDESATFASLRLAIKQAETDQEKKQSKYNLMFHRFCNTLDSHSVLFGMIPSQSEYCSLFCGAITFLVKASVNHENIVSGFSHALENISKDIELADQIVDIHDNPRIQKVIGDLYGHYFSFLAESLDWYNAKLLKRVFKSVNENYLGQVCEKVDRIQRIARMMFQQAEIDHMTLFRDTAISIRDQMEHVREDLNEGLGDVQRRMDRVERVGQEALKYQRKNNALLELFAEDIKKLRWADRNERILAFHRNREREERECDEPLFSGGAIEDDRIEASSLKVAQLSQEEADLPRSSSSTTIARRAKVDSKPQTRYCLSEIRKRAQGMMRYMSDVSEFIETINLESSTEESDILAAFSDWMPSSIPMIWLHDNRVEDKDTYPNRASASAIRVIQNTVEIGIPTLAFFCRWPYEYNPHNLNDGAQQCLVDLVYNLIRQGIEHFPQNIETRLDLCSERFTQLERNPIGLENALRLLKDVLKLGPRIIVIVLDGIDHLDTLQVSHEMEALMGILIEAIVSHQRRQGIIKVLFTTSMESELLQRVALGNEGLMERVAVSSMPNNRNISRVEVF